MIVSYLLLMYNSLRSYILVFIAVSIFTDGRFNPLASNTSLFENFTCSGEQAHVSLSDCNLADSCQSTCVNAIGIKCSGE